ncbi:minichromosome maintenance protein MCM, partial [Candidatus Nitrosopelagicus sp.]|nr:minichromosome maintenance protein MCM [Candidatus Nitrosopelagicus sp.]
MTLETQTESALSDYVKKFLLEFKDEKGNFRYVDDIDTMMPSKLKFINVDYNDLVLHPDIESVFHENPDSILEAFSRAIKEILQERFPKYAKKIEHEVRARIANYPVQRSLRQINAEVIGKITSVSGMVLRASEVKPLAKELVFVCPEGHRTDVLLGNGLSLTSPVQCSNPKCNHRELGVEPESSRFIDVQFVRLQELPEDLPPGQLPHYLDVTVKQDLVDNARPGDRVVLTGVVRIEQEKMSGVSKNSSPLYRLRLDGNNVEFLGGGKKDKKSRKIQREEISSEDEKMIKSLSKSPDLYQQLIDSYAPHITGHEMIKESILLLMAGSTQRELEDGSKIRGDINIFLVGDPGTAKSEMLKFCVRVAPRGLYTSGRGSTAAGLTAAVVRDTNGIFMLEAGATVLGDQGLVCIDEFDKMKTEDRSALHEVMEQQTASISKGGIVATLNARTSILAAANPMYGKYDPFKNITENVNLPVPLLTRFDLIFVVRDKPSKEKDTKIAQHIINLHTPSGIDKKSLIDSETLTKYLSYVKRINPTLTKEAEEKILDYYMKMRTVEAEEMITVTPRQLEGLIRLATARARLLLKTQVEAEDAQRAIDLLQGMFEVAGIDVNTGKVDLGVLQGRPRSEVSKMQLFMDIMKSLEGEHKTPVDEKQLVEELTKTEKFTEEEAKNFTRKMARDS